MSGTIEHVLADLTGESELLDQAVAGLDEQQWSTPTPAVGWDIATQIAHLAWTDAVSRDAIENGERWRAVAADAANAPDRFVETGARFWANQSPADLLGAWRVGRAELTKALRTSDVGSKIAWFGPPMSATSMATARYMETWAHGLDVFDALGIALEPTDRIRNVAHIGVRTRDFAFKTRGLAAPTAEFAVTLVAPSGAKWSWGPADAEQTVSGSAVDFCRLVTQRVHRDDTNLVAVGPEADRWLDLAQAFAGRPGPGREPRLKP